MAWPRFGAIRLSGLRGYGARPSLHHFLGMDEEWPPHVQHQGLGRLQPVSPRAFRDEMIGRGASPALLRELEASDAVGHYSMPVVPTSAAEHDDLMVPRKTAKALVAKPPLSECKSIVFGGGCNRQMSAMGLKGGLRHFRSRERGGRRRRPPARDSKLTLGTSACASRAGRCSLGPDLTLRRPTPVRGRERRIGAWISVGGNFGGREYPTWWRAAKRTPHWCGLPGCAPGP